MHSITICIITQTYKDTLYNYFTVNQQSHLTWFAFTLDGDNSDSKAKLSVADIALNLATITNSKAIAVGFLNIFLVCDENRQCST